jgi:hypothetical protein
VTHTPPARPPEALGRVRGQWGQTPYPPLARTGERVKVLPLLPPLNRNATTTARSGGACPAARSCATKIFAEQVAAHRLNHFDFNARCFDGRCEPPPTERSSGCRTMLSDASQCTRLAADLIALGLLLGHGVASGGRAMTFDSKERRDG